MRTPVPADAGDQVLAYLRDHPGGSSVIQVVVGTQLLESSVRRILPGLLDNGLVDREKSNLGRGTSDTWRATTRADVELTE